DGPGPFRLGGRSPLRLSNDACSRMFLPIPAPMFAHSLSFDFRPLILVFRIVCFESSVLISQKQFTHFGSRTAGWRPHHMEKFTSLTGFAAPLDISNVDTDMIIPKQYLKTIKRTGLGSGLFAELRYKEDGTENPEFVLNNPAYREAKILVAEDNFGCGSSRQRR